MYENKKYYFECARPKMTLPLSFACIFRCSFSHQQHVSKLNLNTKANSIVCGNCNYLINCYWTGRGTINWTSTTFDGFLKTESSIKWQVRGPAVLPSSVVEKRTMDYERSIIPLNAVAIDCLPIHGSASQFGEWQTLQDQRHCATPNAWSSSLWNVANKSNRTHCGRVTKP